MTLAVLLFLGIITYVPDDDALARQFSLEIAFNPALNSVQNALGLVGAFLAWVFVPGFLGYPTLVLPVLLFAWGYVTFRHFTPRNLRWLSGLSLVGMVLVSCLAGWITRATTTDLSLWSGKAGMALSGGLHRLLGSIGSFLVLAVLASVLILVVVERDIQSALDRIEGFFAARFKGLHAWWEDWRIGRTERKLERREFREAEAARRLKERKAQENARPREKAKLRNPSRPTAQAPARRTPPEPTRRTPPPRVTDDLTPPASPRPAPSPPAPTPSRPDPRAKAPMPQPPALEVPTKDIELHVRKGVSEKKANLDERKVDNPVPEVPYQMPSVELLEDDSDAEAPIDFEQLEENKQILLDTLSTYNIELSDINALVGPTVTLYELTPAPGVKISRIKALEDDLAMAMAARGIRMIAPIPGKSAVGVEIPNRYRELVRVRSVLNTARFRDAQMELPVALGKTIEGEVYIEDLTKMPHILVAGATGSGKSVGINNLIACLLYACHPENLKFVLIDPKKIELQQYAQIFNHFIAMPENSDDPITTDFAHALYILKSCLREMEDRYDLLSSAAVRSIKEYNKRFRAGRLPKTDGHRHLPYVVIVIDELADLMMTAGKEIEAPIARLAQMARAVGIHLVVATQRPSVNVITGLIKANFPSRVAFQVATGVDSRTILDQNGAEQLVGNGDFLYMHGSKIIRLQSPYISLDEVERITGYIAKQPGRGPYLLPAIEEESETTALSSNGSKADIKDDLFSEAAHIIVRAQQGSVSLLQRRLSVGYARAARLVDQLEQAGIVGPFEGSKARQVLIGNEIELDEYLKTMAG